MSRKTMNKTCLFCKIVNNNINSYKVLDNKYLYAFLDISPLSKGHTILITKKHYDKFYDVPHSLLKKIIIAQNKISKNIYKNLKPLGMNYLINENSIAQQSVFHFHIHLIPKYSQNDGLIINPSTKHNKIDYQLEEIIKKITS